MSSFSTAHAIITDSAAFENFTVGTGRCPPGAGAISIPSSLRMLPVSNCVSHLRTALAPTSVIFMFAIGNGRMCLSKAIL